MVVVEPLVAESPLVLSLPLVRHQHLLLGQHQLLHLAKTQAVLVLLQHLDSQV